MRVNLKKGISLYDWIAFVQKAGMWHAQVELKSPLWRQRKGWRGGKLVDTVTISWCA